MKIQFQTFLKRKQIFGFPCCSTRENLSIDVSISGNYYYRTDIDEAMVIYFLGVLKDRYGFGIPIWKHVCTQKISTQKLKISG